MKKYDDGLCSIQEYNQFKTRIFDAVDEWINHCDSDPEMGIAIEQATLDVEIMSKREYYETCFNNAERSHDCSSTELCNKEDFLRQREEELKLVSNSSRVQQETCNSKPQAREWFPLETLATDGEADADAILDLADQFCFVR